MDYLQLSYFQLGVAASLIVLNGAISVALGLGLERRLAWAAVRTVTQLTLLGMLLEAVFEIQAWWLVACLMCLMTGIAGFAAVGRVNRRHPGIWINSLVSMFASSWLMAGVALGAIVQPTPWHSPQYAIPLLGMILGNTLNGISLGLDRLLAEFSRRDEIETLLALGATRWEAAQSAVQEAVKTGMIPTINAMMIVGIVSLPGMMTGQLLAGVAPAEAVKYQIAIMFLIASGTGLGTVLVVLLGYRRLFNRSHQFEAEQIQRVQRPG